VSPCRGEGNPKAVVIRSRVNTTDLTSEQVKFLSQLGEFRDEGKAWVAGCEPAGFLEAVELLKKAAVKDLFVQFRE
jgi:hypothetical protein